MISGAILFFVGNCGLVNIMTFVLRLSWMQFVIFIFQYLIVF